MMIGLGCWLGRVHNGRLEHDRMVAVGESTPVANLAKNIIRVNGVNSIICNI